MAELDGQTPAGRPTRPLSPGRIVLRLPLTPDSEATLDMPRPMTETEWSRMLLILAEVKPGIVPPAEIPKTGTAADAGSYDGR